MSRVWKAILFAILLLSLIGIIIGLVVATGGAGWMIRGWDTIQCTLTTLLGTVVSGRDPTWPTEKVNDLIDKLHPDDAFMVKTRSILTQTEPVERSVKMLTSTLTLLDTTMGLPENVRPVSNSGEDLNHLCHLCQGVTGKIAPVAEEIDGSLGKALEDARTQVNDKLSGKELTDLHKSLKDAADPMNEVRDGVMDSVGKSLIKEGGFTDVEDILNLIALIVLLVCILGFLPWVCGCCALSLAAFKPLRSQPTEKGNIYRSSPPRCACCSWCIGICLAPLPLFLGFLLSAIAIPVSSVCMVLDDLKGDTFDKWAPALGVEDKGTEEDWQNTLNVVDACTNRDSDGRIMNVLTVEDSDSGGRISIRDKLLQETRGRMHKEFDKIKDRKIDTSMSESESFKDMFNLLDIPVDSITSFDPDRIENLQKETQFVGFALKPDLATQAFSTSANCDGVAVAKDGPLKDSQLAGTTVPGIGDFRGALQGEGMSGACLGSDCTCPMSGGDPTLLAAANAIFEIKQKLHSSTRYRCDLFQTADGTTCDPKDFIRDGVMPDCIQKSVNGELVVDVKEITCSYPEFVQYVANYRQRLEVAVRYLEDEAKALLPEISEGLRDHIDVNLLDIMLEIVDGVTCVPFKNTFHGAIDGVCYHAARGLIDIAEGFKILGMFLVILCCLMYYLWRRGVDNISERLYKVKEVLVVGEPQEAAPAGAAKGPQEAAQGDAPNEVVVR